jgi:hypothetical protein
VRRCSRSAVIKRSLPRIAVRSSSNKNASYIFGLQYCYRVQEQSDGRNYAMALLVITIYKREYAVRACFRYMRLVQYKVHENESICYFKRHLTTTSLTSSTMKLNMMAIPVNRRTTQTIT